MRVSTTVARRVATAALLAACVPLAVAASLEDDLGRNETRVRGAAYPFERGKTVREIALVERLERLGYRRVHERPDEPGEFFYGHEAFWIYRRAHRLHGRDHAPELLGLTLRRADGRILGAVDAQGTPLETLDGPWLEPETLAESLAADRAERVRVRIEDLPPHVWQAVLAAEDARFLEHPGVDARSLARAALANVKSGGVEQGGSTITQQLIKNRDLSPKRSLGRKASEAVRALWLEAEYDKREILEAYLNQVYLGHADGLAVYGVGAAARVYFSKPAADLSLAEGATLAAMIQGPNRLSPERHPDQVRRRRDWVLSRLAELDWVDDPRTIDEAKQTALRVRRSPAVPEGPAHFLSLVSVEAGLEAPERVKNGRGVVVETTLDPYLQGLAESAVAEGLGRLRREHPRLRDMPLAAALVALDASTGEILAYVGGDPALRDDFDRARRAERQPGSAVKPFVLLAAFDGCGDGRTLYPSSRIADKPLTLALPSGDWSPENYEREFRGVVTARRALADSLNVPTVRVARWCGFERTADVFRRAGIELPDDPPPSFVLGSVEVTPLELAGAYAVMAGNGLAVQPFGVRRVEKPEGRRLGRNKPERRRVVRAETAWLVRDVMRTAVLDGTARAARIDDLEVAAKTGTSSELRDAWLAGHAGSVVTVVWVGLDDGRPLGLTGATAAAPIWKTFMTAAVPARPTLAHDAPDGIVRALVDPRTGLRVGRGNRRAVEEVFRRGALPARDRFWRADPAEAVVE